MAIQDIFTKTSRIYLDIQQQIRKMYEGYKKKDDYDLNELNQAFDVLIQVILLYLSVSDNNVSNKELEFIDKLTVDEDILVEYNKNFNKNLTWDKLNDMFLGQTQFIQFIDSTYELFYFKLSKLIMFLAAVDSYTKKDYYSYFRTNLEEMLKYFIQIDSDTSNNQIEYILNKVFMSKYKELKKMFEIVQFKNN